MAHPEDPKSGGVTPAGEQRQSLPDGGAGAPTSAPRSRKWEPGDGWPLPPVESGATSSRRAWTEGDWITCPRCEGQKYDRGSCGLCGNLGVLDGNGERFHCDCRADDWVEGDNAAVRCEQCGGYAGEPGTSIRLVAAEERSAS